MKHPNTPEEKAKDHSAKPLPPDPHRVNHGTEPGDSFGERWTNKVYSTPDPHPGRGQEPAEPGKHHEPTPFLRG